MPTIYDIAKLAGVSATTVSKVFNNYSEVSDKTKERVLAIAKEIGYVPNLNARTTRTNRSYLIGVVFSEDVGIGLEHQFFAPVLEAFRKAVGEKGYDTIFINKSVGDRQIGYLDHSKYRNVDGLFIITAMPNDMNFERLIDSDFKCVSTDMPLDNLPRVLSDNKAGVYMALDYLRKVGHSRIAHIAGPLATISAGERDMAFRAYHEDQHLDLDHRLLKEAWEFNAQASYDVTIDLFNGLSKSDYPTAIFVSADIMAIGVIKALKFLGLSVPDDVSIIGFDDIALAELMSPALTTVKQDKEAIGKQLAKALIAMIETDDDQLKQKRIPVELIIRESVKALK